MARDYHREVFDSRIPPRGHAPRDRRPRSLLPRGLHAGDGRGRRAVRRRRAPQQPQGPGALRARRAHPAAGGALLGPGPAPEVHEPPGRGGPGPVPHRSHGLLGGRAGGRAPLRRLQRCRQRRARGPSRPLRGLRHLAHAGSAARARRAGARGAAAGHPGRVHGHQYRRARALRSRVLSRARARGGAAPARAAPSHQRDRRRAPHALLPEQSARQSVR